VMLARPVFFFRNPTHNSSAVWWCFRNQARNFAAVSKKVGGIPVLQSHRVPQQRANGVGRRCPDGQSSSDGFPLYSTTIVPDDSLPSVSRTLIVTWFNPR